jgi:transposase
VLANAMRGLAPEFGFTVSLSIDEREDLMALVDADETFPQAARWPIRGIAWPPERAGRKHQRFRSGDRRLCVQDVTACRLATVPGIGPTTASLMAATVADIGAPKSARHFAAWLGLVPRQHSTGGKIRLGRII